MLKITRELTYHAAIEVIMRAGGIPNKNLIDKTIRESRIKIAEPGKKWRVSSDMDEHAKAGYRVCAIEWVEK